MHTYTSTEPCLKKMKRDVKNGKGTEIKAGESVDLKWMEPKPHFTALVKPGTEDRVLVATKNLHLYVNVSKMPSIYLMEKWSDDGVAKTVLGHRTEPDGWDPEGSPSWILALRLI